LQAGGVRPLYDLKSVADYADVPDLLDAVANGDCDAAGVLPADVADADSATRAKLDTVTESVPIPYGVMVYPPNTPLGLRLALDDGFVSVADGSAARPLKDLLGQDALVRVEAGDFDDLIVFISQSGLDFSQLGA
jgi:ABC-type phosphate/phosphonate transport system substrate-binding protein